MVRTGPGAFRVESERVERLLARHDLGNEEALRYLEDRLRAMGVIKALEAEGFEAGDDVEIAGTVFEFDPGAPRAEQAPRTLPAVATVVVKLGSSIVADSRGEVRLDVVAPICEEVAARHAAGDSLVLVTSGAIARGIRIMGLDARPTAMAELQAASAVGQGPLYRAYDALLAEHGVASAQVLLTFFDLSARTHYLNARHTLRKLVDWRVVPVINENDTTTTDEISFGDNDFLAAQVAILLGADRLLLLTDTDGLHTADPARDARPSGSTRSGPSRRSRAFRSASRPRRSAPAGCARRWWPRRWPPRPASRP